MPEPLWDAFKTLANAFYYYFVITTLDPRLTALLLAIEHKN